MPHTNCWMFAYFTRWNLYTFYIYSFYMVHQFLCFFAFSIVARWHNCVDDFFRSLLLPPPPPSHLFDCWLICDASNIMKYLQCIYLHAFFCYKKIIKHLKCDLWPQDFFLFQNKMYKHFRYAYEVIFFRFL